MASEQLPLESLGQPCSGHCSSQLWVPLGGPLYPMEIIRVSFVSTAPTCRLMQSERCARLTANSIYMSSTAGRAIINLILKLSKIVHEFNSLYFADQNWRHERFVFCFWSYGNLLRYFGCAGNFKTAHKSVSRCINPL